MPKKRGIVLTYVVVCVLVVFGSLAEMPFELELQLARAAHVARVKLIESVQFSWSGEHFQVTEGTMPPSRLPGGFPRPVGSYPFSGTLTMRGADMRLDMAQLGWFHAKAVTLPSTSEHVYHNDIGRTLRITGREGTQDSINLKHGKIMAVNPIVPQGPSRKSLFFAYSSNPQGLYGDHVAALRMEKTAAGEMLVVGNTDYNRPRWVGATRTEYYLDPRRDFLPVRHVMMLADGQIYYDTSIDYGEHDVVGFAPVRIKTIKYKMLDLAVIESTWDLPITSFDLNLDLEEGFFEIDFPEGTIVTDEIENIEYKVGDAYAGRQSPKLTVAEWIHGEPVTVETVRGKVVVLAFWDSTHESSAELVATLNVLTEKHADIVVIAFHSADGEQDALRELVDKENIAFRVALDKPSFSDYPGAMFEKCTVTEPPSVYIIDADGTVKFQDLALAVVEEAVERVIARE